jgi:raffinose/stachyose/melibiose transport system permease protein
MMKTEALRRRERRQTFMTVLFTVISVLYLMPVVLVLINSLKANAFVNTETFKLPTAESFVGLKNYVKGMTFGNFAFYKVVFYSFFITIASTALILLCTSMAAWYISRVGSLVSKIVYYLCVFSIPDGHVHAGPDDGPAASEHPVDDPRDLSGLRRRSGGVYVYGLRQEPAAGD